MGPIIHEHHLELNQSLLTGGNELLYNLDLSHLYENLACDLVNAISESDSNSTA